MVNLSMQHGTSGDSPHGYGYWGIVLGPVFHRYGEGHRFAKLACDLVEKHSFSRKPGGSFRFGGHWLVLDASDRYCDRFRSESHSRRD